MELTYAIEIAKAKLGKEIFANLEIKLNETSDELVFGVSRKENEITITYSEKCMIFRALTYVKEHRNEKNYDIKVKKHFAQNGLMVDCSRNGVVNIPALENLILMQALMGQNQLLLYTEDTYVLDKYPFFGYQRNGYTKEEIKHIVSYGLDFGVELVPCIQTLSHLGRPLHWEPMIPLRDGPSTLLCENEQVFEFIEEMIKFSRECFKSKEIHIGMDESFELGLGRYLYDKPFKDRVKLFCEHLAKVQDICKKYEFLPMIWSDMFFRLENKEEYYTDKPLSESTLKLIPEGVELVYWDYYHDNKTVYDDMFKFHFQTKNPIVFAGGSWRWKGFAPALQRSLEFSIEALKSCLDHDVKNVFVTAWGDNGNECSIASVLATVALYSNMDYFSTCDNKDTSSLLEAVTGDPLDRMLLMDLADKPANKTLCPSYNPSKYFLYQDPMLGLFDDQVKDDFAKNYKEHALKLHQASKESKMFAYVYRVLAILCEALSIKVDIGVRMRKAYKANDKKALKKIAKNDIPTLLKILNKLNHHHHLQWDYENKPFGFDVLDGRMGYLKNRLITTKETLEKYIKGYVKNISELETEILPYNGHEYEVSWNWWGTTVTANNLY